MENVIRAGRDPVAITVLWIAPICFTSGERFDEKRFEVGRRETSLSPAMAALVPMPSLIANWIASAAGEQPVARGRR